MDENIYKPKLGDLLCLSAYERVQDKLLAE